MKKYIISFTIIFLLLGTVTLAKSNPEGQPFQIVWEAINYLQEQIDNIELIPGPPGPQGSQGEQGLPGTSLKVIDANNNEVGIYLGVRNLTNYEVWIKELNLATLIDMRLMEINTETVSSATLYEELNCEGYPIGRNVYPYVLYRIQDGNKYDWTYVMAKDGFNPRVNIATKSRWNDSTQTCINAPMSVDGTEIEPITIPVFVPPFKVVEE